MAIPNKLARKWGLPSALAQRTPEFARTWEAYLSLLKTHPPTHVETIIEVHNTKDLLSPWPAASAALRRTVPTEL
eukprot:1936359-Amphidinium_carterae.1